MGASAPIFLIQISKQGCAIMPLSHFSGKVPGAFPGIPERSRLSCWEFQKNIGSIPGNSGKRLTQLLGISKKHWINSWEFRKKAGSAAEYFQKKLDRFLGIPEKG
jgi:hypothetical protein